MALTGPDPDAGHGQGQHGLPGGQPMGLSGLHGGDATGTTDPSAPTGNNFTQVNSVNYHSINVIPVITDGMEVDPQSFNDLAEVARANANSASRLGAAMAELHNSTANLATGLGGLHNSQAKTNQQLAQIAVVLDHLAQANGQTTEAVASAARTMEHSASRPTSPHPAGVAPAGGAAPAPASTDMAAILGRLVALQEDQAQVRRAVNADLGGSLAWRPRNITRLMEWVAVSKDRFPLSNGPQVDAFQNVYDSLSNLLTAATWDPQTDAFANVPADLLHADVQWDHPYIRQVQTQINSLQKAGVFLGSDAARADAVRAIRPFFRKEKEVEGFFNPPGQAGKKGDGGAHGNQPGQAGTRAQKRQAWRDRQPQPWKQRQQQQQQQQQQPHHFQRGGGGPGRGSGGRGGNGRGGGGNPNPPPAGPNEGQG